MTRDLLSDSESSSSDSDSDRGAKLTNGDDAGFKVNQSYAHKFEHNKKREEKQRLEEKLGKDTRKRKRGDESAPDDDDSTSESEDEGELDTEAIDAEMMATIDAIRSKDPRIYDENAKFYTAIEDNGEEGTEKVKKEKPMHLQDYHRRNLLNGDADEEANEDEQPLTYNQEQEQLKKSIVKEMHAAAEDSDNEAQGADFLVAKEKPKKRKKKEPTLDVEKADKDPEKFLSNFMSSRAWAYPDERNLVPFESDDEDDDRRAEEYEQAYNMRFEDPAKANEKLRSHARDMAAKYSVRRDETNPRQKKRETEKAKKEAAKQELREQKARLRKLRIEEVEDKVKRIKRAAGLRSKDLQPEDWSHFVDEDWDDDQWEQEMQKRFGDEYYAEQDVESDADDGNGKKKPKKPKFDHDIDIKDIVPDFEDEEEQPEFSLSDEDANEPVPKQKKQSHKQQKEDKNRDSKRERRIIEQLVDDQLQLELDHSLQPTSSKHSGSSGSNKAAASSFRYRETSPKSFGLTSRDILLADDSQLNQYAGLKKLAAFRDTEKKRKDQKHLGKKARLRKWRADVFGNEDGMEARELVPSKTEPIAMDVDDNEDGGINIVDGSRKKKKRRRNKNKQKTGDMEI